MTSHHEENCAQNIDERKAKIRKLNDQLRCQQKDGQVYLTRGILAFGQNIPSIVQSVADFHDFTQDNDPYREHDMGSLTFNGQKIFWKIDYNDSNMEYASPDPADGSVTSRVLTIMLAREY